MAPAATSYKVFYGGFSGVGRNSPASHVVVNAPATTVVVPNLNNGQTYYLAVIASNSVGDGLLSNEVSARPETPPVAITWWQLQTGDGALNLRYSPISHATSYNIYWSETAGVTTSANKQSTTHSTAHTITGLTNGTTYYVSITAVNGGGESSLAAEKSKAPRLAMPVAPKGFRADAGDKKVELSWQAIPNAIAYNVHWAAGAGVSHAHTDTTSTGYQVNKVLIPSGTTTSFSVDQVQTVSGGATTDLVNGTAYFFTIQAVNASGDGAKAVEISATPQAPSSVPTIPTGLSAEPGDEAVTLQWAAVAGASSYKVYWGAGSVGTQFVENIAGSEMAIVSGLSDGTSYSFTVAAVNSSGESGQSAAITASPLNLIDAALVDGDSSKLNASEEPALIERILSELSGALNAEQTAAMNMIYGANSAVKYHPAASSQLLACSNSATCIPMMIALDSTQKIRHLAYANEVSGTKAIAYGSMPPIQFMENSPVLDYQQAFKNTIHWLTGIDPATAPLKVAVININYYAAGASGYTFSNWVQREYLISGNYFTPSPVPAGKYPWELTFCDGPPQVSGSVHIADDEIAAKCFANQDLVIIGDGAMMAGARDAVKLGAATQSALASNVPVMFFNSGWATTDAGKAVVQALGMSFPEPGSGNFFVKAQSDWPDYAAMLKAVASGSPLKTTINHLKSASYFPDWSQCAAGAAGRVYCIPTQWQAGVKDYAKEFEDGAAEAMSKLKSLEESGTDLFALKGHNLEKLLVLLGDVYRKQIIYPMEKGVTSDHEFLKASFADHLVYNVRHVEFTPPDMGDFFDVSTISSIVTQPLTRSFKPNARGGSTSVGAYLLPGKKVTIRRTGSGTKNIKVFVNMMRPNGTREFDAIEETWAQAGANNWVRKLNKGYSRPKFVQSAHITLPPNGSVTLTPAYGGPLYADITGESADISLEISNAAEHAFLQDGSQQDQVSQYQIDLAATNLPWTDIKTNFVEIHSLTEFMRAAIKPPPFNGDLTKMLELTWIYEVKDTYDFAGFTGPGLDLTQKVKDFCTSKTWNCIDADIHASPKTLHINTDYHASCGGMCSGNPFDSSEYFNPLGWGESHELGHNLQKARTKIFDRKSGEVSNNIFPLHKMSSYYKVDQMNISSDYWHRLEYYKTFTLLQAAKAAHPADLDARRQAAFQAIWAKTGAYDQNGERVTFYRQIAHLGDMLPALFDNGWEIFTLLHLHERLFTDAIQSDAGWQANKDALGFTHANYANYIAAQGVNKGEVFMPISLSFITGINLVNFFETWGIDVSAEAEAQIAAYGFPAWTEVFYVPALVETGTVGQEKGKAHAFRSMRESTSTPVYPAGTEVSLDGVSTFPVLPGSAPIVAPHLPGP